MHLHIPGLHIAPLYLAPMARAVEAACPGVRCTTTSIVSGVGGDAYRDLARACRGPSVPPCSAWEGLRARYSIPEADGYVLASWSAGYGYTRELLRVEGRPGDVVCVAALDSIYAGLRGADTVAPHDLACWVALAEEAVAGGVSFAIGASAIDYMESMPTGRYASTGRVADAIARALGLLPSGSTRLRAGSLIIEHYPGQDAEAHVRAVRDWGPELVAAGVRAWLAEHQSAPTEPAPDTVVPLPPDAHELAAGDRGGDVVAMQRALGLERADGAWGPVTTRALGAFQRSTGIPVRARWGERERAAVEAQVKGIDVSHHQPPIDWPRVRASGVEFVVVRASYGTTTDRRAAEHWLGAGAAGMMRQGYLFLRPGMPVAPQVSCAVAALPECQGWWVDVESDPGSPGVRHEAAELELARRMLAATAREVGVYSAWGWWEACRLGELAPDSPVWSAGSHADHLPGDALQVPAGVDRWVMYQPRIAAVPGVAGACDIDLWADRRTLARWAV